MIAHPEVVNAAAISARQEKWSERAVVLVVKAEGGEVTESELLAFYEGIRTALAGA